MKRWKLCALVLVSLFAAGPLPGQGQPRSDIREVKVKRYVAPGNIWKGETVMETNWNKICEDPQGRIWFSGGDHWGTDRTNVAGQYERPWGFGNTVVSFYDPKSDTVTEVFELDRKARSSPTSRPRGTARSTPISCPTRRAISGRPGTWVPPTTTSSPTRTIPKSYAGGAILKYDPRTRKTQYFGVPAPFGGTVALYLDEKRSTVHGFSVDRGTVLEAQYRHPRVPPLRDQRPRRRPRDDHGPRRHVLFRERIQRPHPVRSRQRNVRGPADHDSRTSGLGRSPPGMSSTASRRRASCGAWTRRPTRSRNTATWSASRKSGSIRRTWRLTRQWGRLYMIAGGHGITLSGMPILTIFDLKAKKFYWPGKIDVDGCYGAVCGRDHTVYFSCYAAHPRAEGQSRTGYPPAHARPLRSALESGGIELTKKILRSL